jgi:hypothetical protein
MTRIVGVILIPRGLGICHLAWVSTKWLNLREAIPEYDIPCLHIGLVEPLLAYCMEEYTAKKFLWHSRIYSKSQVILTCVNKTLKLYAATVRIYPGCSFIQYFYTKGLLYLERAVKARAENQSQICPRGLACFLSGPPSGNH